MSPELATAHNRFGIGARPGDLDHDVDARAWLVHQLRGDAGAAAFAQMPPSTVYLHEEAVALAQARMRKRAQAADDVANPIRAASVVTRTASVARTGRKGLRARLQAELDARYRHAIGTPDGFAERLVRFWSNHFAVSVDKRPALLYAAPMEREAIRPNVFGRFDALLVAVEQHPAMLRYLDNVR